jgi:hypothetical protein
LDLPWDVTDDLESSERYAKQKKLISTGAGGLFLKILKTGIIFEIKK